MANLTTQSVTRAGLTRATVSAAGGGDTFTPGSFAFFYIFNAGGGAITVTFVTPNSLEGDIGIADAAVSVPAGLDRYLGPFPSNYFADATDGLVHVTYSGVSSVTVAALKLAQP